MRKVLVAVFAVVFLASSEARSSAPEIPGNSIRIIVPFSAGGPTDVLARVVAKILVDKLGVTTYVENKPGAMPQANGSPIYQKLVAAMKEVNESAEAKRKFAEMGVEPGALYGDEFRAFVDSEIARWGEVVKKATFHRSNGCRPRSLRTG